MENPFWQANFWGIVGTVSGALGLIVSWLNWRYSKPKIEIAQVKLKVPRDLKKIYGSKTKEYLKNHALVFEMDIRLRNKKGGPGSIEKPYLLIKIPCEKTWGFQKFNIIKIKPRTQHQEQTRIDSNTYSTETIRHGEAWNFRGGQTIDDELEYWVRNVEDFYAIVQNYPDVLYGIEYSNNFGRRIKQRIDDVVEK